MTLVAHLGGTREKDLVNENGSEEWGKEWDWSGDGRLVSNVLNASLEWHWQALKG